MSFCASCGADNANDARFCNKCGATMASGAPTKLPTPSPSNTGTSITLAGIGIRSQGQTNTVLGLGALAFLALGVGIAYVFMHADGGAHVASADPTTAPATGDAIPTGVDVPSGDFVMTSGARVVKRGASAPSSDVAPATRLAPADPAAPTDPAATHVAAARAHPRGAADPTATHIATPDPSVDPTAPSAHAGTPSASGSTATPPPSSAVDWAAASDTVPADVSDEPDYQMQMYSTQVRRFIRQYLLPQATSCFDHASATSRDPISGTVVIGFDIDARGHAQGAAIDRNTTHLDTLARCLQTNVGSWQLPPPPAGTAPIQMQMPFTR